MLTNHSFFFFFNWATLMLFRDHYGSFLHVNRADIGAVVADWGRVGAVFVQVVNLLTGKTLEVRGVGLCFQVLEELDVCLAWVLAVSNLLLETLDLRNSFMLCFGLNFDHFLCNFPLFFFVDLL